jgi:hypothetical protein
MPREIIIGILSLLGTVIGTFSGIMTANKLSNYRISQLEKKVEKHNQVIDRTYNLEKKTALIEQEQNEIKTDISDIKIDIKGLKEKNA